MFTNGRQEDLHLLIHMRLSKIKIDEFDEQSFDVNDFDTQR
jgi:hypothetical protein